MLKDVLDFVMSRTNMTRETALREINYAWKECWKSDDLPDSVFEITVEPIDSNARISLPWYVDEVRGVKQNFGAGHTRINLNTPRPYYQDETYIQSPFIWRILGKTPLLRSIINATTVDLTFTQPVSEQVIVSLLGPNDNGSLVREQIVFAPNETTHRSVHRFTDFSSVAKDKITETDLLVNDADGNQLVHVPNIAFSAQNTVVQVTDKCFVICNFCRCFDILYKKVTPYLYYDEQQVPDEEVLMAKTMEWILLSKDGKEKQAVMHGTKARELLTAFNADTRGIEHKIDVPTDRFATLYPGKL